MKNGNVYVNELHATLPRLLALFDTDPVSPSFGEGDRFHWAWKLIDFGNGTFQGAANGLARLWMAGLLPDEILPESIDHWIAACFVGAERLRRRNGSMEEAFPYESSFCVTALVAYDLLTSIELQGDRLSPKERDERLAVVAPMIHFQHKADEYHAFISNHLATAAVALYKWHALTGERGEKRGREILDRILKHQSEEGWYEEYGGADPGYQSLCTYYLADLHRLRPDLGLGPSLHRSVRFCGFVILRLLNITVMRSLRVGNLIKRLLVKLLITGGRPLRSVVRRTITWNEKGVKINDEWQLAKGEKLTPVEVDGDFSAIHMASKGYWQRQDDK